MKFHLGLRKKEIDYLLDVFKQFSEIEEVIIFGSRAKKNYKSGSDIDLAIKGRNIKSKLYEFNNRLGKIEKDLKAGDLKSYKNGYKKLTKIYNKLRRSPQLDYEGKEMLYCKLMGLIDKVDKAIRK